jgi:cytidine deaminase
MNLSNLYNVAFDILTQKKSDGFGFSVNDGSTVTVLSTTDGTIFKAINGNKVVNGNLVSTCSEMEAVTSMVKANKSAIDTMVTLNVENGEFVMPCESCIDLILQIDKSNIDCNVMTNINDSVKLRSLTDRVIEEETPPSKTNEVKTIQTADSFDDWDEGWDVSDAPVSQNEPEKTSTRIDDINDPMPNRPVNQNKSASRYYQSMYTNITPTPVANSISVSPIVSQNGKNSKPFRGSNSISDIMKRNGLSESDKKDFNKQRLFNAFTTDTISSPNAEGNATSEKQLLSKKELLKLAKEKKKMAKRDAKILDATNKNK